MYGNKLHIYWVGGAIVVFAFFIQSRKMNGLNGENLAIACSGWLCMKNGLVCLLVHRLHYWGQFCHEQ